MSATATIRAASGIANAAPSRATSRAASGIANAGGVEGNEPFRVGAPSDHLPLGLPAGSSATTAQTCIGVEHRTLRFFSRASKRSGSLQVDVIFAGRARTIGTIDASTTWAPTDVLPMVVNELAPRARQRDQRGLPLHAARSTSWSIDDVYVDPFGSR